MTEETEFPAEDFDKIATLPQRDTLERMLKFGWTLSHMWKRDEGDIVAWMISRTPGGKGWTHAYIEADGTLKRYTDRVRVRFGKDEEDD